jgi:hypothetical protein
MAMASGFTCRDTGEKFFFTAADGQPAAGRSVAPAAIVVFLMKSRLVSIFPLLLLSSSCILSSVFCLLFFLFALLPYRISL